MIIYMIQNSKDSGCYIGQTSGSLEARRSRHLRDLRRGGHSNARLQHSFNKYGEANFEFETIEHHITAEECNLAEAFFISYLRFLGAKIYNFSEGGGAPRHSIETRMKMSAIRKGNVSEYAKQKAREVHTGRIVGPQTRAKLREVGRRNPPTPKCIQRSAELRRGKPRSAESRLKMSIAHKGKKRPGMADCAIRYNTGRPRSPETIEKMRIAATGRIKSPETIEKLRQIGKAGYAYRFARGFNGRKSKSEYDQDQPAASAT